MTDAYALIKVLNSRYDKTDFSLIINSVESKKEGKEVFANMGAVLNNFLKITPRHLGAIPRDKTVANAIRTQKPFLITSPESRASKAVKEISTTLLA